MLLLRIVGGLVDFIVGSFIWAAVIALAALAAPFVLIGFFIYEIFWNTKVFMFYLPLVPGLLVDMWYDVPVGRFFLSVLIVIVGWWIVYPVLRWVIHRKLRNMGYE
jgi:hypothetical protein